MSEQQHANTGLTPAQRILNDLWKEHIRDEFATRDADATLFSSAALSSVEASL